MPNYSKRPKKYERLNTSRLFIRYEYSPFVPEEDLEKVKWAEDFRRLAQILGGGLNRLHLNEGVLWRKGLFAVPSFKALNLGDSVAVRIGVMS